MGRIRQLRRLRPFGVVVATVVVVSTLAAPAANAAGTQPVSGSGAGKTEIVYQSPLVSDENYTSSGALGSGTLHLVYPSASSSGTALLTRADGATLVGAVTTQGASDFTGAFTWILALTSGTGAWSGANASLTITGQQHLTVSGSYDMRAEETFTFTGSLTTPVTTPTSPRACRRGGWHHFTRADGRPFRNRRQCIRWARNHRH